MTHDSSLDDGRNPVDVLADEFAERLRNGESPSMAEYVAKYPEHAEQIEELFPGVSLLEELSQKQESEASFMHRPQPDSLPPGHRFGDIEIVREVGRGGMGIVYEAYQHSLHRSVAVKAINGSAVHSPNQVARFQREAQAAAQLHHTNIVPVFGVGEQDGTNYYVMQLIHGLGLDAILTELARKTRHSTSRDETAPVGDDAVSARGLADVLVSGELSDSAIRAAGGGVAGGSVLTRSAPDPDATVLFRQPRDEDAISDHDQTVLEHQTRDRSQNSTGELGEENTPQTFARSSLVLEEEILQEGSAGASPSQGDTPERDAVEAEPRLASLGPRYWRNIARIGLQVASGLQYAHTQGTLHRDIKPANLLLDTEGTAWIADFGLAKLLEQEDVTKTGDVVGTLRYMAPEQFRGEADARSDLYSLGLTFYELLTLRPAYDDTDRQQLIAKKLTPDDPAHPRKRHPGIPRDLETIVLKCIAWEPDGRYQTAGGLVADLQAFLEDRPIMARRISPAERFWRWCKRNPAVAGLSTAVMVLLMTIASLASIGYVRAEERAEVMAGLKEEADQERTKTEQIADLQWEALNRIYETFVPDRFAGPVEASMDEDDETGLETEPTTATVLSPQTAAMLEEMLTSFDKIAAIRGEDERYLEETAKANRKVGDLHVRLGQYEEAIEAFGRANDRYNDLQQLRGERDAQTSVLIARLHNGLGVAQQHLGQWETANDSLAQSLAILTSSGLDAADPAIRSELAATHYLMGRRPPHWGRPPSRREGDHRPDRGGPHRDGDRRPPPTGDHPPPPTGIAGERPDGPLPQQRDAGHSRDRGDGRERSLAPTVREGMSRRDHGRNRDGHRHGGWDDRANREHLETAVAILRPLIDESPTAAESRFLLALCHLELSLSHSRSPAGDSGDEMLAAAIGILTQLVAEHPEEPDYLYQLSEAHEQRYYRWKKGSWPLFLRHESGIGKRFPLNVATPDEAAVVPPLSPMLPYLSLLHGFGINDGRTGLAGIVEAEQDLQTAVRLSETLMRQQPNVPRYAESHRSLLFNLADVKAARGEPKDARKLLDEAALLQQTIRNRFPEADHRRGMRDTLNELLLARVSLQLGKPGDARDVLQELIAKTEQVERDENRRRGFEPFRKEFGRLVSLMLAEASQAQKDMDARKPEERRPSRRRDHRPESRIEN